MIYRWVVALILLSSLSLGQAHAAFITSKHRDDYSRLNFNWESEVLYDLKQKDNLVTIKFKRSHPVTKAQIDSQLKSEILSVYSFTTNKDSLEITFELKKPAHALTLNKGGLVVLDFLFDIQPEDKKKPVEKKEEQKKPETRKGQEDKNEFTDAKVPDINNKPPQEEQKPDLSTVNILIEETVEGLKLTFDFLEESKAGAFIETSDMWLYFDKSVKFAWDESDMNSSQFISDLVAYKSNNLSALKIDLASEPDKAAFYKKGSQWVLETADLQGIEPVYVEPKVEDGKVTLKDENFGEPIFAQMPETGHSRYFIPSASGSVCLERKRRYIDFNLLPTILGAIVDPLSQGLSIEKKENKLFISKDTGLALSDPQDIVATRKRYQQPPLLDFRTWQSNLDDTSENKRDLQWEIINTPKQARTPKRLELVRHYLLTKRYHEALGLLAAALMYDPSLEKSPYYYSLKGIATFATQRYDEARKIFEHEVLAGDPEMELWAELSKCRTRPKNANYETIAAGKEYLSSYPTFIKNPALLFAADASMVQKKDAQPFLVLLEHADLLPRQKEHLEYLQAYYDAGSEKKGDAMSRLENFSKTMQSEFRLKSSLLLTQLKAEAKSITPKEEIAILEKLRFHWTGDQNEYQLWSRLSDCYKQEKNYDRSLKFLRKSIRHFPKLASSDMLQQRGEILFREALEDKGSDLLMLIGLFQEYDIFIPKDQRRLKIQEELIDLMVKADLVEQALSMMDQILKDVSYDEKQKIRLRTRYGILALLNDQPDKALMALNYQPGEQLPGDLGDQRRFLVAQAYLMQSKYDDMRVILTNDHTEAAFELVTQSYIDQRDWVNLATYIQTHLADQKQAGNKIEPEAVMRLATAYGLLKRDEDLKKLRAEHLPMMLASPFKEAFELITAQNPSDFSSAGLAKELSQSQQLTKFLETYREKVKKEGLSVL